MTKDELRNRLRRGDIAPVYTLYGPEPHLRDLAAKEIAKRAFTDTDLRDFNYTEFSLNDTSNVRNALAAAEQLPMMANRRVIRVTDVRVAASAARDSLKEENEGALAAYLSRPAEHSVIIFIADELNGVRKMTKLLIGGSVAVEFKRLDDKELADWARTQAREKHAEIGEAALRELISRVGADVHRLTNEIAKLAAAVLPEKEITVAIIHELVPYSRELDNFSLTSNLISGRDSAALAVLKKILDDGAEPLALVGLLSASLRRMVLVKELMSRGASRAEAVSAAKLPWQEQENFFAAARRADPSKLAFALTRLSDTDLAIKSSLGGGGPIGTRMQLEMLVCELAAALD